jgi:hypothetical protein
MTVKRIVTTMAAGCAAVVMSAVLGLAAPAPKAQQQPAAGKATPASGVAAKCQAMMAEREKMMADMKAADQRLDELVATMNSASETEKAAATAAVVTEMVAQRRTMRDGMMKMQHGMLGHITEHNQAGRDSMATCPMMRHTGDMKH